MGLARPRQRGVIAIKQLTLPHPTSCPAQLTTGSWRNVPLQQPRTQLCQHLLGSSRDLTTESGRSEPLAKEHQDLGKMPTMERLLLALLFLLQGLHGSSCCADNFRFCGDRNQTKQSRLVYETQEANITIENSPEMLKISAPFPTASVFNSSLQQHLGKYRFCLRWCKEKRRLLLTYGGTDYILSNTTESSFSVSCAPSLSNKTRDSLLFNVSYTHDKAANSSLGSAAVYSFQLRAAGDPGRASAVMENETVEELTSLGTTVRNPSRPAGDPGRASAVTENKIVEELTSLGNSMKNPSRAAGRQTNALDSYQKLLRLERNLEQVEFKENNKTFGNSTVRATVWKLKPSRDPQDLSFTSTLKVSAAVPGVQAFSPESGPESSRPEGTTGSPSASVHHRPPPDQNGSRVLGEKVIGLTVGNTNVSGLSQDVVLEFFHDQLPRNVTPRCVFWHVSANRAPGSWKSDGCETERSDAVTVCRCNHLTYFAVLMVASPEIDEIHRQPLTIITIIGCVTSAVASLVTIIFICCSRRKPRHSTINNIHMNLLGAIFLLDVNFLLTELLASSGSEGVCCAGALFLHFSLLSCLAWMGIEGYSLYRLVVKVFNGQVESFLLKLCLAGWGIPFLMVGVIFLADWKNYGLLHIDVLDSLGNSTSAAMCFVTNQLVHSIVNMGFFSLVFIFNLVMLGAMVWAISRLKSTGQKWEHALLLLGLSLVLGIPWALVFFSFLSGAVRLVTLYLFTVINSLQGVFIFLWYRTMVWQARKPKSYLQSTSDYDKVQLSTSHTSD
nr:adhesion G-protein coupled receptor G1 [Pelodiscus sinensis]|eukprot:XP_014426005.1 adhesion G-protein coupled receptor G1 [Pelodiscus sinensis]